MANIGAAESDALELVMAVTEFSLTDMALRGTEFLTPEQFDQIKAYADRRIGGEPVDAILGSREFYGRKFQISADVLSPRGDTETLIERCLSALEGKTAPHILDMGTGSGAILATLLAEIKDATGIASDISDAALAVAQSNCEALGVSSRVRFIQSDWYENIHGQYDLIVSNPPYITSDAMRSLETEVAAYDPPLALHGGQDGLDPYRLILSDYAPFLKKGGAIWVEIGFDQAEAVTALFAENGLSDIDCVQDLGGNDRCIGAVRPLL